MSKTNNKRKQPKRTPKQRYSLLFVLAVASLVFVLICCNFSALGMMLSRSESRSVNIEGVLGSESFEISRGNPVYLDNIDTEMKNIRITTGGDKLEYADVTVAFTDDNFRYDDAYDYNKATVRMKSGLDSRNFMLLSSFGEVGTIKLSSESTVEITAIDINVFPEFRFSFLGFVTTFAVLVCIFFGLWELPLTKKNEKAVLICGAVLCAIVLNTAAMISTTCADPLLVKLPDDVSKEDQYTQLFDAFHDGRLNLDIDYDTSKLDALENPYDRSERNENDLHGSFWDRAYYGGKFYSYFGAAPVITVYYPIYIITRHVPSPLFASALLAVHCIIFITLLYWLFLRKFTKDVPIVLAVLGLIALVFGSTVLAITAEAQFYFIAVLSGIASTTAFLYFLFEAYFCKNFRLRIILLVLAGVSVALIAASRPTMLLYCLIGMIPAVYIFRDGKETTKNKALYVVSVAVPVIIGAALIMTYNYKRFENPFEFGFNYQLTVSRAKANTIKLAMIPAAIYHYFIQQPSFKSSFPYIGIESNPLDSYTRYNYSGRTMGILTYPLSWGAVFLPFVLRKAERFKLLVLTSLPCAVLLMSFIDMCKAGSHYRYTADIAFFFLLASLVAVFNAMGEIKKHSDRAYKLTYALVAAALGATVVFGTLLIFAGEGKTMLEEYIYATELLRKI